MSEVEQYVETDEDRYYEVDGLFSGRPEAVKFEQVSDMVTGRVVEVFTRQRTKFGTTEPEFWDDGTPKLEPVIVLMTADGLRTLYVGSWRMRKAIGEAFSEAGVRGPRPGGQLVVTFTGTETFPGGAQPAKVYEAAYDPPGKAPVELGAPEPSRPRGGWQISGECAGGDHTSCDSRQCQCSCGHPRAGQIPGQMALDGEAPPF